MYICDICIYDVYIYMMYIYVCVIYILHVCVCVCVCVCVRVCTYIIFIYHTPTHTNTHTHAHTHTHTHLIHGARSDEALWYSSRRLKTSSAVHSLELVSKRDLMHSQKRPEDEQRRALA